MCLHVHNNWGEFIWLGERYWHHPSMAHSAGLRMWCGAEQGPTEKCPTLDQAMVQRRIGRFRSSSLPNWNSGRFFFSPMRLAWPVHTTPRAMTGRCGHKNGQGGHLEHLETGRKLAGSWKPCLEAGSRVWKPRHAAERARGPHDPSPQGRALPTHALEAAGRVSGPKS
jgi:hypothetical protein